MTKQDFEQLRQVASGLPRMESIGVFSPLRDGESVLFPGSTALPRWRWNLNKPSSRRFDLLVASNVFMYSPDPDRWFRNALSSCKYLLLLDLIRRRRSPDIEFGLDGDQIRYAVNDERPVVDNYFDLSRLGDRLLACRTFEGGANEYDGSPMHVLAVIRGDLAGPVIRIDDYPTGIRPVLSDLTPLHNVLEKFEAHALPYYLGIVPALLNDEMKRFLGDLEHMIPVVHGYDHAHFKYAPILATKGDPYNSKTVGVFNEFEGQDYSAILQKLSDGRKILQDVTGKDVDRYIPPCNIADRKTARALTEAGYRSYLSDKKIPGSTLPWLKTDFMGRSNQYRYDRSPDVLALHVTWEWDVEREGDAGSLNKLLHHLVEQRRLERARQTALAGLVHTPTFATSAA